MQIQKPTICRAVIYTESHAWITEENVDRGISTVTYPGIITRVHDGGAVDIMVFVEGSCVIAKRVPHCRGGTKGHTWTYPKHTSEMVEVDE